MEHVEEPEPAEISKHDSTDDRGEGRSSIEDEIDESDSETTLVYEIHVTDGSNDERLEGRRGKALNLNVILSALVIGKIKWWLTMRAARR